MSENAVSVQNVTFHYGAKRALGDVSFDLPASRFCALLGPNGAGKSTLYALLTGLLAPQKGKVALAGHDLAHTPRKALARLGVVFQQPTLDLDHTVMGNMLYFAALHGISASKAWPKVEAALARLNMLERAQEKTRTLNGGHRRRMEIARALIHDPAVLLLDEPTVGLDAASREAITAHVHDLTQEGLTVFWATHLVDEIYPQDDVIILHQGEVLKHATAQEIAAKSSLKDQFLTLTGGQET